ncbi:DUF4157 domain-containing protein [Frankia sp. CNm7]|uniref:DUF4157 domain-containing protein n=1 Tax=Frankia nepalensis TaxID=1836974 RepID=A0A937RGQ7_9ACTN|nr:DUF4157 domain-containing protein [Frankia nepalensis]MBL7495713.1 DUF4157 domain-containing protein [Frankia nepalensis]MBL7508987.1 DUF4157 domain-containing protein [Frankia nepalensis]MBL7520830.1 DUF4157 domain-containing protein [Frankia nepalensis]MBL7629787.1 DUF4157 domain-containing protein [Frankia nepalensis]
MRTTTADPKQVTTSAPARTADTAAPPARAGSHCAPALLRMQRSHGNRHVQRVVASARASAAPAAAPAMAGAGLRVGPSHDPAERAADDIARAVAGVTVPDGGPAPMPLAPPEVGDAGGALSRGTSAAVLAARAGGMRVPSSLLARTEQAVGADLGGVRLHVGRDVDALSDALAARAFTVGQDVFVHRADYRPGTPGGDALIAHELAHVAHPGPAPVRRKGRKLGAAKAALFNVGISFAKTAGGPLYDLFHYLWYFKQSKKTGVSHENRVDLHPFKDLLKLAGNRTKENGKAKLVPEDAVKRYGVPGIGHVLLFLRAIGSSLYKRFASYISWLALVCTLIGFAPGAQAALPVAAALGTISLLLNVMKGGIDFVANSWTLILAWIRYICLDDPVYLDSPEVGLYVESYKEYRKSRGELLDDALKIGMGGLLAGFGGATQDNSSFVAGADKYFTPFADASASIDAAVKDQPNFNAHEAGEKFAAEKIPDAMTKEIVGNSTSWVTKGRLEGNKNAKLDTVGTQTMQHNPDVQMLLSANIIGKVNEQQTREPGLAPNALVPRSKLPGPPGTSLKGVVGLLVNPLGALATILMMVADLCVMLSGRQGAQDAPAYDPGPPPPAHNPGGPPPTDDPGPPPPVPDNTASAPPPVLDNPATADAKASATQPGAAVQQPPQPGQRKKHGKTAGTAGPGSGKKRGKTAGKARPKSGEKSTKAVRQTSVEASEETSRGGPQSTPSAQRHGTGPAAERADRGLFFIGFADVERYDDAEPDDTELGDTIATSDDLITAPRDPSTAPDDVDAAPASLLVMPPAGDMVPDTASRVAMERERYGPVEGPLPSLSTRTRNTLAPRPRPTRRASVEEFVVREIDRIRRSIAREGNHTRELAEMFDSSADAMGSLAESSKNLLRDSK